MIEVALFDIDGILTDGNVYIGPGGQESKKISFDDIDAIFELKRSGVKIGFVSGEKNDFTEYVNARFSPEFFASGCKDKLSFIKMLEKEQKIDMAKVCFVGDSKKDIEVLSYVDYSFAPSDVAEDVKRSAKFVTAASRGAGIIKEVAKNILSKNSSPGQKDNYWEKRIQEHLNAISKMKGSSDLSKLLDEAANLLLHVFKSGSKLLLCGNGGSAADSQHIATELVSRFFKERKALDAEALTVNTSTLTAVANDYTFENIFSRQIEAKGKPGDVLIAISTSGNSKNIIKAIETAKKVDMKTIGLTGNNRQSQIFSVSDICIGVPSDSTPRIQEGHILIGHLLCDFVEEALFK